jgi:hypothetical protein
MGVELEDYGDLEYNEPTPYETAIEESRLQARNEVALQENLGEPGLFGGLGIVTDVVEFVKENPLPILALGFLGWWLYKNRKD